MYLSFDLNPLTPFEGTMMLNVLSKIRSPFFAAPFIAEICRVTLPEPVTCEGIRCHHCDAPVVCAPMDVHDPCCEGPDVDIGADEDALDALDTYIDEVLDQDYDY